jgi:GNAT superfamily N-acetyltransferase
MEDVEFIGATSQHWPHIERLFSGCGDARRCWCAYWYRSNRDFKAGQGDDNRRFLKKAIESGTASGVLALSGGEAVGWCNIAPRAAQDRLVRATRVLARIDDAPVWSLDCFVVAKDRRRQGLMRPLIAAAIDHARRRGAAIIEAYPFDPERAPGPGPLYLGKLSAFLDLGFKEVARRSPSRPIVRLALD